MCLHFLCSSLSALCVCCWLRIVQPLNLLWLFWWVLMMAHWFYLLCDLVFISSKYLLGTWGHYMHVRWVGSGWFILLSWEVTLFIYAWYFTTKTIVAETISWFCYSFNFLLRRSSYTVILATILGTTTATTTLFGGFDCFFFICFRYVEYILSLSLGYPDLCVCLKGVLWRG